MRKEIFGSQIKFGMTVLLLLLSIFNMQSQTTHPIQRMLIYKNDTIRLDKHFDFKQKRYNIGYHWDWGYKMSKVLSADQIHVFQPDDTIDSGVQNYANYANIIINTPVFANQWKNFQLSRAKSSVFEPTYLVDTSNPFQSFIPRTFDTTRYCMGFANIKGIISSSNTDTNYNRLQLLKNNLNNEVVLSDNWPANDYVTSIYLKKNSQIIDSALHLNLYEKNTFNPSILHTDNITTLDWRGVNNYLNINLRRLDTNDVQNNNDIVLSLKIEYVTFQYDTTRTNGTIDTIIPRKRGYIRFDSIPATHPDSSFSLTTGRGLIRKMKTRADTINTINITRAMLPKGNLTQKDITVSAWFINDGKLNENHNYGLSGFPKDSVHKHIDSLKIIVQYYDTCDIGIDWISINNRATRELSFGWLDTMLAKKLQKSINLYSSSTFSNKFIKPFRWYLNDEPLYMSEWYSRHYLTKLFGQIFTQEGGLPTPQFNYYCQPRENWVGAGKILAWKTNPFFPYQSSHYTGSDVHIRDSIFRWCNQGWAGAAFYNHKDWTKQNLLNSHYETFNYFLPFNNDSSITYFNYYKNNNKLPTEFSGYGCLNDIEAYGYIGLLDPKINQFLFNGINWWGQIWNDPAYYNVYDKNKTYSNSYDKRMLTGEEFKYFAKRIIYYGAKGFVLDGEQQYIEYLTGTNISFMREKLHYSQGKVNTMGLNNMPAWDFLDTDSIGSDFLNPNDINDVLYKGIDLTRLKTYMGIDSMRYYMGRKSMRREFKKVTEFIRSQDSLLMSLQLIGAYSKGFTEHLVHDNKYGDTVFTKFLKHKETRTRPLNRVRPYYEQDGWDNYSNTPIDSGFYDITILKDTAKMNIDTEFYLGVLNKRTGPHLLLDSADCGQSDSIAFITTAELDNWCDGVDSLQWRKYYWKRLGTREITVFFNDSTYNPITHYLKITEVENRDTTGYSTWNYWRKNKYENILDTKLYANQPLKVKLLPGDGKLLKVEKILRDSLTDTCDCDHILPQKYLEFKRRSTDNCLTLDFTLYPCPNIQADSFQLVINSAIIPPCLQKFFRITIEKNDTVIPGTYPVDLTSSTSSPFMLYTGYKSGDKKIKLKYILCPDSTMGPVGTPCTDQELTNLTITAFFGNGYCGKTIETVTSVQLDNFNQDFNKFFQDEFNNFSIVPNPATSFIDLSFETSLSINSKVYIVDEQGRILKERLITADSNEKLTIDVNQLSNGTYFIAVYDKDKLIKGKPFLIMK